MPSLHGYRQTHRGPRFPPVEAQRVLKAGDLARAGPLFESSAARSSCRAVYCTARVQEVLSP